ncbi:MAG: response regulator [Candidatus Sungbacteria bacterium]|nr:response regulator [bacterium]MDZ4260396.1 response regulator [Candidatus Sungbacteria bacterium]
MSNEVQKKLIVLIEDEEVMVNLLVSKLEKAGYMVKTALDGMSGLELVRSEKPDLVLLDMMLPRLSGFGILEKLNEDKIIPELPVIVISNSGQPVEIDRALKLGVRDYLIKVNFDPNELMSKVGRLFGAEGDGVKKAAVKDERTVAANVLIVEDDIFLVELLQRKFDQENFKTYRAMDVATARAIVNSERIDAVLLDIVLPGIDGFVFLRELKANEAQRNIPVIIISNLSRKEEQQRGLEAGAVDYIIKAHATPGDIVLKVKQYLKKPA